MLAAKLITQGQDANCTKLTCFQLTDAQQILYFSRAVSKRETNSISIESKTCEITTTWNPVRTSASGSCTVYKIKISSWSSISRNVDPILLHREAMYFSKCCPRLWLLHISEGLPRALPYLSKGKQKNEVGHNATLAATNANQKQFQSRLILLSRTVSCIQFPTIWQLPEQNGMDKQHFWLNHAGPAIRLRR